MFRFLSVLLFMFVGGLVAVQANPMVEEFEAQLEEAERQGITGPEIDQLRQMLKKIKADEASSDSHTGSSSGNAATVDQRKTPQAQPQPGAEAANGDTLTYTSASGEAKSVNVDKSQRATYAGSYMNEHQDPAVADFRYELRRDGSAVLEHRVCENCTHELTGEASSRDWQVQYEAVEWAPMVTESGEPMMRNVKDMAGETFQGRVLIVTLQGGKVMSLNHYEDAKGEALGGPYGVPRYRQ